jgi:CheY-like chemotaxis protein
LALPRVLLIDDSETVIAYERAALSGHYAVSAASDGVTGLAAIRSQLPDVVVLDLSMPRMDGEAVLEAMIADPQLRHIPVIIVSSEEERARACLRAGAVAFLHKPMSASDLLAAVDKASRR